MRTATATETDGWRPEAPCPVSRCPHRLEDHHALWPVDDPERAGGRIRGWMRCQADGCDCRWASVYIPRQFRELVSV